MAAITVTPSAVQKNSDTVLMPGTSAAAINAGKAVIFDPNNSYKVTALQATNPLLAITSPPPVVGVLMNTASAANQPCDVAIGGSITIDGPAVVGLCYVVGGAAAGDIAPSADLDASIATWYGVFLAMARSATVLVLNPTLSGSINP